MEDPSYKPARQYKPFYDPVRYKTFLIRLAGGTADMAKDLPDYDRSALIVAGVVFLFYLYFYTIISFLILRDLMSSWIWILCWIVSIVVFYYLLLSAYSIDRYALFVIQMKGNQRKDILSPVYFGNAQQKITLWVVLLGLAAGITFYLNLGRVVITYKNDCYAAVNEAYNANVASVVKVDRSTDSRNSSGKDDWYQQMYDAFKRKGENLYWLYDTLQAERSRLLVLQSLYSAKITKDTSILGTNDYKNYSLLLHANTAGGFVEKAGDNYTYHGITFVPGGSSDVRVIANYNDSLYLVQKKLDRNALLHDNLTNSGKPFYYYFTLSATSPDNSLSRTTFLLDPLTRGWLVKLLHYENPKLTARQKLEYFIRSLKDNEGIMIMLGAIILLELFSVLQLQTCMRRIRWSDYPDLLDLYRRSQARNTTETRKGLEEKLEVLDSLLEESAGNIELRSPARAELRQIGARSDPAHFTVLGDFYYKQKNFDKALTAYMDGYERFPLEVEFLSKAADMYKKLGYAEQGTVLEQQYIKEKNALDIRKNLRKTFLLRDIEIKDHPFYGDLEWRFNGQMNILLGKNGYGKSHLLSILLGLLEDDVTKTFEFTPPNSGASIEISVDIGGQPESADNPTILYSDKKIMNPFKIIPILAIPDTRFIDKSKKEVSRNKEEPDLLENAAHHFLYQKPYADIIGNVMYRICQTYFEGGRTTGGIFALMEDVFYRLTGSRFKVQEIVSKPNSNYEFFVSTEGSEKIQIQKVSQGTFSVMTMIGIIYNYLRARYPDTAETDIARQHAIVFIDEIDAHLHPDWQRKLINILRESFPNVQFFITAHSPLIVAGCRTEEVAVLRKSDKGFKLEYFAHDFVGCSPEELYRIIFQVEAYDDTYLKYKALVPYKKDIEDEIETLQKNGTSPGEEERRLAKLYDDLYYINIVEEKNLMHRGKLKSSKNAAE